MHLHLADLSIEEAAQRLRRGEISSLGLTKAHLERITERDGAYRAFVHVAADNALAAAAQADGLLTCGKDLGALHGIPVAVKDMFDTRDMPTTYGSDVYVRHRPAQDAEVVTRLRDAGAVILGKLDTYEFAMVGPSFDRSCPPAVNPWDAKRFTGGSSSGCAAAVAGGLIRTTIGSDTGGSVRSPAAYCGVVGLKPSFGAICTRGVHPLSPSMDHVGLVSASVAEAATTLDVICDRNADEVGRPAAAISRLGQPIAGLRIGYARAWFAHDPHMQPSVLAALDEAASTLSLLGAQIDEIALPDAALFEAAGALIIHAEAFQLHHTLLARSGSQYSRKVFQNICAGMVLTQADMELGRRAADALRHEVQSKVFSQVDLLLTAATLTPAIPLCDFAVDDAAVWTPMRTIAFNLTGHPALVVPCGFAGHLPLGLQLVGRPGDESTLCQVGHAFERATDFAAVKPKAIAYPVHPVHPAQVR